MARVLIVDDEPDIRFMMKLIFELAGHEVFDARHGGAALECLQQARPDLVITDMMMPVMGGAELIERLRSAPETTAIPILAVSANPELASATAATAAMGKPFLPRTLLETAVSLLQSDGG